MEEDRKQPKPTPRTLEEILNECIRTTDQGIDGGEPQYTYESPDGGYDVYYVNKRKDGTLYLKGGYHRFARNYPGISGW